MVTVQFEMFGVMVKNIILNRDEMKKDGQGKKSPTANVCSLNIKI